jgi:hypothetical protein
MAPLFEGEVTFRGCDVPVAEALPPVYFMEDGAEKLLEGFERHRVPVSMWMHRTLWTEVGSEFTSPAEFAIHFDWVEIMTALASQSVRALHDKSEFGGWFPPTPGWAARRSDAILASARMSPLSRPGATLVDQSG